MGKILIIDDERDVIELVSYVLQRDGHEILEAHDGKEGLQCVKDEKPDLIVLDIMMPEMDGYTLNQHLMKDANARHIPVLVLTAKGGMKETSAMAPNIRYHIEKPFDPSEFRRRVSTLLKK